MPGAITDLYAWIVVSVFVASTLASRRATGPARAIAAVGWVLFAGFWAVLAPHFLFVEKSLIEGVLNVVAVPACVYTGYLVWRTRPSLLILSRAVAVMGVVYLPFITVQALEEAAIESLTRQVAFLVESLGYDVMIQVGDKGYMSELVLTNGAGHYFVTPVLLACTGLGSIAIVAGLLLAVPGTPRRRLTGVLTVVPLIYVLNLVRAVFIVVAFSKQWFQIAVDEVQMLFAASDPAMVSYYIADKIISQSLSVVVLVAITLALLRFVPGLVTVIEEVAFVATRTEYDLRSEVEQIV